MILDAFTFLAGSVSPTGVLSGQLITTNSQLSTNTLDLGPLTLGGNQVGDLGAGEPLELEISILVAPATATTVQFQFIQADDAALSTNVQVISQTDAFPIASLTVGTIVPLRMDQAAPYAPKRYVGVRTVSTGATVTALSIVAAIVKNVQSMKNLYFKSGFLVS